MRQAEVQTDNQSKKASGIQKKEKQDYKVHKERSKKTAGNSRTRHIS